MKYTKKFDVIIVGAGAAGLMCAIEAGKRSRKVLLIDHAKAVGEKIRISGGGRCNFTNIHATADNYLSNNPRFCISALQRYTQHDFIKLVEKYDIAYHEKTLGQLFCDGSSKQIIEMLLAECELSHVEVLLSCGVENIEKIEKGFDVFMSDGQTLETESLVIATGGPSIPKMGATGWGYEVARKFGMNIFEPRAGLVPFTLEGMKELSGISLDVIVTCAGKSFHEALLFTHRGLSGPAILQISSYWKEGEEIKINLAPGVDVLQQLKEFRESNPKQEIQTYLNQILPKRLAQYICEKNGYDGRIADQSNDKLLEIVSTICQWNILPNGTEGFRTAEVTLGGVDTDELSSKTFESKKNEGLYFIGEVVDVTGHLGGFNFQWAWSSGHAAGQFV